MDVCQQSKTALAKGNSHHKQLHDALEQLQALFLSHAFFMCNRDIVTWLWRVQAWVLNVFTSNE